MPIWVDVDGATARVAIYTGNDDAPMANPSAYIGTRTKFHTDWNYLPFVPAKMVVGSEAVPAAFGTAARGDPLRRTITLGAHGMGGIPFLYGFITIAGVIRPLCGTVPVLVTANGNTIHWTLGVNGTNVFISEGRSSPVAFVDPPTISYEIFVSDKMV